MSFASASASVMTQFAAAWCSALVFRHSLVIVRDRAGGRHDRRMLATESVDSDEPVALGTRQLRQLALLLRDELRRQDERRQVGLGK